jgi:hypothetical protein
MSIQIVHALVEIYENIDLLCEKTKTMLDKRDLNIYPLLEQFIHGLGTK